MPCWRGVEHDTVIIHSLHLHAALPAAYKGCMISFAQRHINCSADSPVCAPGASPPQSSLLHLCRGWTPLVLLGSRRRPRRPQRLSPVWGPPPAQGRDACRLFLVWSRCRCRNKKARAIANRFSRPSTGDGVLVNFCWKASLRLCAGSVEIISTLRLTAASCTAKLHSPSKA